MSDRVKHWDKVVQNLSVFGHWDYGKPIDNFTGLGMRKQMFEDW